MSGLAWTARTVSTVVAEVIRILENPMGKEAQEEEALKMRHPAACKTCDFPVIFFSATNSRDTHRSKSPTDPSSLVTCCVQLRFFFSQRFCAHLSNACFRRARDTRLPR